MRYIDPTGHWEDEGCGTGGPGSPSGGTGCDLPSTSNEPEPDPDDDDENEGAVTCGAGNLVNCPPSPYILPDFEGILNRYPITLMHPSDIFPKAVGWIPIYSTDGKLIGYRAIYYAPDYATFNPKNVTLPTAIPAVIPYVFENGLKIVTKIGEKHGWKIICPHCTMVVTVLVGLDIANSAITFEGHPRLEPMTPVHEVSPLNLDEMLNPFQPFP